MLSSGTGFERYLHENSRVTWTAASTNHVRITLHEITQHPPLSLFSNVSSAARVAASNTSSTPSPVKEEHSRYFRAPISRAVVVPSFSAVKCRDFFRISSWAIGSSRRSFFRPTNMIGTLGQRSFASSTHYECHHVRTYNNDPVPLSLPCA